SVRNTSFSGDGTAALQRGVTIDGTSVSTVTSGIEFTDTSIANMTRAGMLIQNNNATSNVTYDGVIFSDVASNGGVVSPLLTIRNNAGTNTFDIATGNPPAGSVITANSLSDTGGEGIIIQNNGNGALANSNRIDIGNISLTNTVDQGIYVFDDSSDLNIRSDNGTGIVRNTSGAGILVTGGTPDVNYFGTIEQDSTGGAPGYVLHAVDIATTNSVITLNGPGATPFTGSGDGILIQRVNATDQLDKRGTGLTPTFGVSVNGASLTSSGPTAVRIEGVPGTAATGTYDFSNISILGATSDGILLSDLGATTRFNNLTLDLPGTLASGVSATAAGTVIIGGTSTLKTDSDTMATIRIYENLAGTLTTPEFTLISVISANPTGGTGAPAFGDPPYGAISLKDANSGFINISSVFTVPIEDPLNPGTFNPGAGTGDNIDNPANVPVAVGGTVISP
ncbi:MAG: hypothetical protein ACR2NF_02900, partial [Pirellulales bacterium]